jgi:acyl-CoA synthetase (NDP forming)
MADDRPSGRTHERISARETGVSAQARADGPIMSGATGLTALRDVEPLLTPASVALVGASERHPAVVRTVSSGPAEVWLVNPRRERVLGKRCYRSVADLPAVPEVAMIVVGHQAAAEAVSEALEVGVAALVVPGLGAEAGANGRPVAQKIAELADVAGVPLLGTNCMGYLRPEGTSLWIGTPPKSIVAGHVSVLAQSGSIAEGLLAAGPRIGFRTVVSSGSEVSRDAADLLAALANDAGTRAIGLFLETVRRPEAFRLALRSCAQAGKPVVCLKVGRSAAAAAVALTHTGAMVGSDRAFSALLRAYGVIEVTDMPELVETLEVLGRRRWPRGTRMAAVSESGGEAALLADHADAAGLVLEPIPDQAASALREEFPNFVELCNPLDVWAVDTVERIFPRCFEALRDSGSYDILVAEIELTRHRSEPDNAWCSQVVTALASASAGRDLFPAVISTNCVDPPSEIARLAHEADIALLRGTGAAARALAAVATWNPRWPPAPTGGAPVQVCDFLRDGFLPEFESATLLSRYGVKFAPFRRARTGIEAARAAEELGFPVVVKVDNAAHKSAVQGVVLGVSSPQEAAEIAERLGGAVLVARQLHGCLEVICGFQRDPMFGPVLTVGLGGSLAEALGAVATALAPISHEDARRLAAAPPGIKLDSPAHRDLIAVLTALSRLASERPEIEAVDINPLVITATGATAVDALIATRAKEPNELHQTRAPQS